jgi:hypothetical protein
MPSPLSPSELASLLASVESEGRQFSPSELEAVLALPPRSELSREERRLATIERLLPRLSGDAAERLLLERRSLLRLVHGVPLSVELPLSVCSADLCSSS